MPAVVVSAGTDVISPGAVTPLAAFSDTGTRHGTGFKLDDGRIGTVAHALIDARRVGLGDPLTAELAELHGPNAVPNASSTEHDLAALLIDSDLTSMPAAGRPAAVGDVVALAGYGRDARLTAITGEVIYRGDGAAYRLERPDIYVIGARVDEGWSGGPVVNAAGEVVAVIVGLERTSGVAIAVPIEHLPTP